jgi:hypothetical protein
VIKLILETSRKNSVGSRLSEESALPSWMVDLDSEYGLLLLIQIPDSYMLNGSDAKTFGSQDFVGVMGVGAIMLC